MKFIFNVILASSIIARPTSSTSATIHAAKANHLLELRGNFLPSLLQNAHQLLSLSTVVWSEEADCCAVGVSSAGSADAMHVVLDVVRKVKIDHILDVFDV